MHSRILTRIVEWVKTHEFCGVEFLERGEKIWVCVRSWEATVLCRLCAVVLDSYSSDCKQEVAILARVIDAVGPDVSVVYVYGGAHAFLDAFTSFSVNGCYQKLVECPMFHQHLFKGSIQGTVSSAFETFDLFSIT